MVSEDTIYFDDKWKSAQCGVSETFINIRYLIRFIIRLLDVILRVLSILLLWIIVGGLQALIYVTLEAIGLFFMAFVSKKYVLYFIIFL